MDSMVNNSTSGCPVIPSYDKVTQIGVGNYTAMAGTGVCTQICPLQTSFRSRDPVNFTSQGCPEYQYFKSVEEVNKWEGDRVCCCTLWCSSSKAVDFEHPGVLFFLLFLTAASLWVSKAILKKVRHRLVDIPFLIGKFVYTPPLIAKYRCPFSLPGEKYPEHIKHTGKDCSHKWFFTLDSLYSHCDVEHHVSDVEVVDRQRSKYLHQPKILSGPEVEMFQYTGIFITLSVYGILILPMIFCFVIYIEFKRRLNMSYCLQVDQRGDTDAIIVSISVFATLLAIILSLFAFSRWKHKKWKLDYVISYTLVFAFLCLWLPLFFYHIIVYDNIRYRSDYNYVAAILLTLNVLPIIYTTFTNSDNALPIDVAELVKRFKNKKADGDNIYVITVCGASNQSVNGVYVATPCTIVERNVPLHHVIPSSDTKNTLQSLVDDYRDDDIKSMDVCVILNKSTNQRGVKGNIVGINRVASAEVTFNVRLTLDFEAMERESYVLSGNPQKFPTFVKLDWACQNKYTHTISRHVISNPGERSTPFWYICEGESTDRIHLKASRYIARADPVNSPIPPSSGWHVVDNAANDKIKDHRAPSIIIQDVTIFEAEYKAKLRAETASRKRRAVYWLCYFFAIIFLALFGIKTYSSRCIASVGAAQYVGWFHFGIILMIELALAWQAMAGVMINAMTITILHVLSRISMVLAGSKYFYSAGCVVYIMFAMLLVYHVTSSQWPTLKPRQIVRKKLSSVLPQWLYSGAASGANSVSSGSALDGELLDELLLSPILKVAGILDMVLSLVPVHLPSTQKFIERTIRNPVWILLYLTIFFILGTEYVIKERFSTLPKLNVLGNECFQYEIGYVVVTFVFLAYATLDFQKCYDFYGHKFDRLPHPKVRSRALFCIVLWCGMAWIIFKFSALRGNVEVLFAMIAFPFLCVIGNWTIRNWAANDYVFLIDLNVQGIRPMSFDNQLKLLSDQALDAVDITKWWPRLKTFIIDWLKRFRKSFFTATGMGLFFGILFSTASIYPYFDGEENDLTTGYVFMFIVLICVLTYLQILKWFNTFRIPTMVTVADGFCIAGLCLELYKSGKINEPTLITIAVLIPMLQLGIMALYQLYIDDFEIVWGLPPAMLDCCCCKGRKVWSNIIFIVCLVEVSVLVYGILMVEIFPEIRYLGILVDTRSTPPTANVVNGCVEENDEQQCLLIAPIALAAYVVQLVVLWVVYVWVSHRFAFPYYLQVIGICFVAALFVFTLAGAFIFDSITSKSVVTLLMSFLFLSYYSIYKQAAATSNIFYGNFIFPVFSIDARTTKLKSRSREIAYGFYAIMVAMTWSIYQAITGDTLKYAGGAKQNGIFLFCFTSALLVASISSLLRVTRDKFWNAWQRLKHYPEIIDQIRMQTLREETIHNMQGENNEEGNVDRESLVALHQIIALTANDADVERKTYHTYDDCIKAVGKVPAKMPNIFEFLDRSLHEGFGELTSHTTNLTHLAAKTKFARAMAKHKAVSAFKDTLANGNASMKKKADGFKSAVKAATSAKAAAQHIVNLKNKIDITKDGIFKGLNNLDTRKPKALSDLQFLIAGDGEEEEDLPELLVSGCGLSAVEGLYCAVRSNDPNSTLQYVHVGDGVSYEIHLRPFDDVLHWTIEYEGEPFYAVRMDLGNEDLQHGDALLKPEGILPPMAGWSCAYVNDNNEGKPRAPEPPPVVTSTELHDWGMVLRASHGILKFQEAMDSILEEEQRIIARFKNLVIETANQQAIHEETVLWNFVRGCMPKLVNQRTNRAPNGSENALSDMSANELRIWSKEKKKKLREFGIMYGALAKIAYEQSQAKALKERETNNKRKDGLKGNNFMVNFGIEDDVRMHQKLAEVMLQYCKRQFNSSLALKRLENIHKRMHDLSKVMSKQTAKNARILRDLYGQYENIFSSLSNLAADADSTGGQAALKFQQEYDRNLVRFTEDWYRLNCAEKRKAQNSEVIIGNKYWKNARRGGSKSLLWAEPPNIEFHWLDEDYLLGKTQLDDVKEIWTKLSQEKIFGFSLDELENDFIVKDDYRYFKDLKPSTSTKAKLERKKCLAHFRREFLKLWYTHNEFTTYAIQFLKDHSEVLVGWTVRDIHKQLEADFQSAFLKNEDITTKFNPHCSVSEDDRNLYQIQLHTFKKVLEGSLGLWEQTEKPCSNVNETRVTIVNPLVAKSKGWPRFIGGATPADIKQGDANDCWLLSAMMIAAARDARQERENRNDRLIIPKLFVNEDNMSSSIHVLQFYRPDTGKWEKVIIDSSVPVRPVSKSTSAKTRSKTQQVLPKAKYASSREPESWVMLIEKAYTKWVSSRAGNDKYDSSNPYDNINFGLIDEALVSFTGGVKSLLPLDTAEGQAEARSGKLWGKLVDFYAKGYLIGASTPSGHDAFWDEHGLVKGHAYAIVSIVTTNPPAGTTSGGKMLLMRNPWGVNPWDFDPPAKPSEDQPWPIQALDWSPMSAMWQGPGSQYMKRKLRVHENVAQDVGMFWITYEDFVRVYAAIFCCRVLDGWRQISLDSGWFEGQMGGVISGPSGFENPQWSLTINAPTAAYFCLSQSIGSKMKYIMLAVVPGGKKLRKPIGPSDIKSSRFFHSGAPNDSREVGFDVPILPPGQYTLIASTFDPGQQGSCRVTIHLKEHSAFSKFEKL